ncbi:DUF5684 domain-containing protein [Anaerofustis stercorihominis]|uniref:DUF5684 domain-containing protein n=1 Tax=Anaerofustis stercorihominis TaxID=214853 RepID=UPI00214BF4D8|nr:DUF5684 domain-containing protein [Anaerofustis stercorihominis]MCR2033546.1 DUF5684 domain-containing protein [Anaerofustis stercorihominis]
MILLLFKYLCDIDIFDSSFDYMKNLISNNVNWGYFILLFLILYLIFYGVVYYKLYEKLGYRGILFIVPFYSLYLLIKKVISEDKGWLWILCFVPYVRDIFYIYLDYKTGIYFKKLTAFNIGLILLPEVFIPILVLLSDKKEHYYDADDKYSIEGDI